MAIIETLIDAKVKTKNDRLETQDAQLDMQDVIAEMESTVQATLAEFPDSTQSALRIPKTPLESFVGVGVSLNGHRTLRQFLIAGISAFISLPIILVALLEEIKKKGGRKYAYVQITNHPSISTWKSSEGAVRRRPLGWGVWYQDVPDTGGDRYYTSVVFTEFTRQCFVSPPGNWKFHYEPSEGVEFTVFVQ